MPEEIPEDVQRWTSKRRAALVLSILKGETSVQEAARKHGLSMAEIEDWRDGFALHPLENVRVGVECQRDGRRAEALLDNLGVHALGKEQRRGRVAKVMKPRREREPRLPKQGLIAA